MHFALPEDYYPFDAQDPRKYVVDDSYTPSWEVSTAMLSQLLQYWCVYTYRSRQWLH